MVRPCAALENKSNSSLLWETDTNMDESFNNTAAGAGRRKRVLYSPQTVINLLPDELPAPYRNENRHIAEAEHELFGLNGIWRFFGMKQVNIVRFEKEIIPLIRAGRILELAGGSGWASALVKIHFPESVVNLSDVAPDYLKRVSIPLTQQMAGPAGLDAYYAADAEAPPFEPESFDTIFIFDSLHHISDIPRLLASAARLLKSGGRFIAVDGCHPSWYRRLKYPAGAPARSRRLGINERLIAFSEWRKMLESVGWPISCLHSYWGDHEELGNSLVGVVAPFVFRCFPRVLRDWLARTDSCPCGLVIIFDK